MFGPLAAGAMFFACLASGGDAAHAAGAERVTATYSINFNGMSVGQFVMRANISERDYSLHADAKISLLAGLIFEWNGKTSTSGRVSDRKPSPNSYSFGYNTADKSERIDVKFSDNGVREIAVNPPSRPIGPRVAVTRQHMQNVVDPLSAVLILGNVGHEKSGTEVCNRRLPIFDGKQRYDLQLSYKRQKKVHLEEGYAYNGPAFICKVKFVPISGHRPADAENNYAARNESMEVWMIPVSQSGLYVPYYIHLPTNVGTASLSAVSIEVGGAGAGRRALAQ